MWGIRKFALNTSQLPRKFQPIPVNVQGEALELFNFNGKPPPLAVRLEKTLPFPRGSVNVHVNVLVNVLVHDRMNTLH